MVQLEKIFRVQGVKNAEKQPDLMTPVDTANNSPKFTYHQVGMKEKVAEGSPTPVPVSESDAPPANENNIEH